MKQTAINTKKMKSDTPKKYVKPSVTRVNLVAREAVLGFCKAAEYIPTAAFPLGSCVNGLTYCNINGS